MWNGGTIGSMVNSWALMPIIVRITLFLSVLGNGIDIARATDRDEGVSLSFQVILRITTTLAATLCGAWGWWRLVEVRSALRSHRGLVVVVIVLCAFAAASTSPSPYVAAFVANAVAAYLLLTVTCVVLWGFKRTIMDCTAALWVFVLSGWALRIVNPDMTMAIEYLSADEQLLRYGGLGHPNLLGAMSCMAMLLLTVAVCQRFVQWLWLLPAIPIFLATIIECKSRTPVAALAIAYIWMFLPLLRQRALYFLAATCVLAFLLSLAGLELAYGIDRAVDWFAFKVTKSGHLEELTSFTGRTEIWMQATELIQRSPLTGYGGGTSNQVMVEHSGHAHNMVLETALLFGIPAALLLCALLAINMHDAWKREIPFVSEFTAFLLPLGLFESPLFGLVPDPAMCVWMACLFGPIVTNFPTFASDMRVRLSSHCPEN